VVWLAIMANHERQLLLAREEEIPKTFGFGTGKAAVIGTANRPFADRSVEGFSELQPIRSRIQPMIYVIVVLVVFVVLLPAWFVATIRHERNTKGWNWINRDSRTMYVDAMKTVASASAIAASLLSAVMSNSIQRPAHVILAAKWAVVCLVVSIVGSVGAVFALTRSYDRARSRFTASEKGRALIEALGRTDVEQGQLNAFELGCILGFAYFGLAGFLVGFVSLGCMIFLA
jgi:hypothetical protein